MTKLKIKFKNGENLNLDCRVFYYTDGFKILKFFGYDERGIRSDYSIKFSSIDKLEIIFDDDVNREDG